MNVMSIPIQICDGAIILSSVKHDEIQQGAELEASPDPKVVVHFDLADGHPLEVGSDGVHLPLVDCNTTILHERGLSIVQIRRAIAVGVVGNFVVILIGHDR